MINKNETAIRAAGMRNREAWRFIVEAVALWGLTGKEGHIEAQETWAIMKQERKRRRSTQQLPFHPNSPQT